MHRVGVAEGLPLSHLLTPQIPSDYICQALSLVSGTRLLGMGKEEKAGQEESWGPGRRHSASPEVSPQRPECPVQEATFTLQVTDTGVERLS